MVDPGQQETIWCTLLIIGGYTALTAVHRLLSRHTFWFYVDLVILVGLAVFLWRTARKQRKRTAISCPMAIVVHQ